MSKQKETFGPGKYFPEKTKDNLIVFRNIITEHSCKNQLIDRKYLEKIPLKFAKLRSLPDMSSKFWI